LAEQGRTKDIEMRAPTSIAAAFVGLAAISAVAVAAPRFPNREAVAPAANIAPAGTRCGHGWHWVPAGYAKHGKWRDGHCSRN
jgi:hypothetical protein